MHGSMEMCAFEHVFGYAWPRESTLKMKIDGVVGSIPVVETWTHFYMWTNLGSDHNKHFKAIY